MQTLDDVTLIQQFISGEATLAANQNLRVEPAFNCVQLLAKRGGLIATLKQIGDRPTVLLRQQSDYAERVHQILLKQHFIPTVIAKQPEFETYQMCDIPAGYEVNHTEARLLWKEWWQNMRQTNPHQIQIELLIFARDTWYPIRNIVCSQSTLFVTSLVNEVCFSGSERVTWLRRLLVQPAVDRTSSLVVPLVSGAARSIAACRAEQISSAVPTLSNHEKFDDEAFRPDLRQVLRFRQGKLYIITALGEIVVEGSHLKFWLNEDKLTDPQRPTRLDGYRDRDRAVNR